jgi:hypothetical protein
VIASMRHALPLIVVLGIGALATELVAGGWLDRPLRAFQLTAADPGYHSIELRNPTAQRLTAAAGGTVTVAVRVENHTARSVTYTARGSVDADPGAATTAAAPPAFTVGSRAGQDIDVERREGDTAP